jgi:hypothetical protein
MQAYFVDVQVLLSDGDRYRDHIAGLRDDLAKVEAGRDALVARVVELEAERVEAENVIRYLRARPETWQEEDRGFRYRGKSGCLLQWPRDSDTGDWIVLLSQIEDRPAREISEEIRRGDVLVEVTE